MDCYFAAVEMRDFPEYRGRPLAVGGSSDRRGVISTCNYEARKFGVRSAMASAYALKLCPDLLLIPGRMSVYKEVSAEIRAIFARYTSLIEPLSLDEATWMYPIARYTKARPPSLPRLFAPISWRKPA